MKTLYICAIRACKLPLSRINSLLFWWEFFVCSIDRACLFACMSTFLAFIYLTTIQWTWQPVFGAPTMYDIRRKLKYMRIRMKPNCIPANFNMQTHTWRAAGKKTRTHNEFWITHLLQIACHRFIWLCMQSMRIAYAKKRLLRSPIHKYSIWHMNWIEFNSIQFSRHMHTLVWAQNIHKFWLLFITTPLPFHIKTNISLD